MEMETPEIRQVSIVAKTSIKNWMTASKALVFSGVNSEKTIFSKIYLFKEVQNGVFQDTV